MVEKRASEFNLYTYELRDGSKAQTIFLGAGRHSRRRSALEGVADIFHEYEGHFWVHPVPSPVSRAFLDFDPELTNDYLECFQSDAAAGFVVDELEHHYGELTNKGERLEIMKLIANPNVYFDSPESEEEEEDGEESNQ